MRRFAVIALVVALTGCGKDDPKSAAPSAGKVKEALAGSPANLASLHKEANKLLDGGLSAYRARLEELRGRPVVVNKWASWCAPCRSEFPFFQRLSVKLGKRVAFIGVNGNDNDGNARKFLDEYPVTYPSYKDGDEKIVGKLPFPQAYPTTAFYDRSGKLVYSHPGGYRNEPDLLEDIERYTK